MGGTREETSKKQRIQLSDHFTYKKLIRFTLPSMVMMVFTSIYSVVDGYFVSNYAGKTPFAAVNLIAPFLMILGTVGFMFGTGGSALVSMKMGEGKKEEANRIFSMLIYISIALGAVLTVVGILFMRPIAHMLGARGDMLRDCVTYGRTVLTALPALILQFEFHSFFVTAEKPNLGLYFTIASGVANMILDWLLVAVLGMGLVGAALATAASEVVGGFGPLIYFAGRNSSLLRLGRTKFDGRALFKTCTNGSSELMSNLSMSLVGMLYNWRLLAYAGQNGVAAYGVLMYVNFGFIALFIGYAVGTAPVIGFHFGAGDKGELKSLLKKSTVVIGCMAVCMFAAGELLGYPLAKLFVGYDRELMELTMSGFRIYSFSFLFAGFAIFGSSFFTALNDGLTSALISFLRTLVFQVTAVLVLPLLFGIDGIWLSVVAAEFIAVAVTVCFIAAKRKKYGYL